MTRIQGQSGRADLTAAIDLTSAQSAQSAFITSMRDRATAFFEKLEASPAHKQTGLKLRLLASADNRDALHSLRELLTKPDAGAEHRAYNVQWWLAENPNLAAALGPEMVKFLQELSSPDGQMKAKGLDDAVDRARRAISGEPPPALPIDPHAPYPVVGGAGVVS